MYRVVVVGWCFVVAGYTEPGSEGPASFPVVHFIGRSNQIFDQFFGSYRIYWRILAFRNYPFPYRFVITHGVAFCTHRQLF